MSKLMARPVDPHPVRDFKIWIALEGRIISFGYNYLSYENQWVVIADSDRGGVFKRTVTKAQAEMMYRLAEKASA